VAAKRHDWGKTDDRFQALLRGTGRSDAYLSLGGSPILLAKSDGMNRIARDRTQLPAGFRHEMLSVQLAERAPLPESLTAERDLILHLIGAHHGFARPFPPVVLDEE